ncbi:MAG: histidine triad nucleotide-binding protein [Deltaproteobacteria bacterium]|nr:histidine triad nucleotide-binding protein [Deltaproteobacteria bacterium]
MTEDNCIFCRIARGEIPAEKLYEDDEIVAFEDANPAAPVHFLVIPKQHIPTLDDVSKDQLPLLGRVMGVATQLAREKGVSEAGYRQLINCRAAGGQVVFHLHVHILGGRQMLRMG